MKKLPVILIFILNLSTSIYGHTGTSEKIVCPVCNDSVVFYLTMSMTTIGGYMDFQKHGAIGYYYEEMISSCKKCYYSGYHSDFDTTFTNSFIDSVKTVTTKYKGKEIDDALECEITAEIKMLSKYKYSNIANIYLLGSYLLKKDSLQIDRRKWFQTKTNEFLIKALEHNEYENSEIATINYLIGEMYRRTGDFVKAIYHYDLAINDKNKKEWLENVAKKQKELAIKEDDNNNI